MRGAIAVGRFQLIPNPANIQKRQAFGYGWTGNRAAQSFQLVTLTRFCHNHGMQAETGQVCDPVRTCFRLVYRRVNIHWGIELNFHNYLP